MINAFKEIRLTNSMVSATGGILRVGAETVVYSSQTGALGGGASVTNLASTGSILYNDIIGLSGINNTTSTNLEITGLTLDNKINSLSGSIGNYALASNLVSTGSALYQDIVGLSGVNNAVATNLQSTGSVLSNRIALFSGNSQSFITLVPTGIDALFISFPQNFSIIPKVQATIETTTNIVYYMVISTRTISGYSGIFSDTIQELSGVYVNTFATVN